jgi:hypothetical protein
MEIIHATPPHFTPTPATSTVEEGDVGQKESSYSRNRKKQQTNIEQSTEEFPPRIEGSTRLIDIRV